LTVIALRGITKAYGGRSVLTDVDLDVDETDMLAIIGPSGAGKTTLLRIINGLEMPDTGTLDLLGSSVPFDRGNDLATRRKMAFIMQKPAPFRDTVRENVAYGLRIRGMSEVDELVDAALAAIGLSDLSDRMATELSGGEMQRMAFARATIFEPAILLLDEFTANLDPQNVKMLERAVQTYQREKGATVVIVTHNLFQAKRLSKKAAFLLDGRIVEVGATDRIFGEPEDRRTREFVSGEMVF
jgi:tungstate transport system ATP-binding protein